MTEAGHRQFLAPDVLQRASCEVFCAAQQAGVAVALLGGYALQQQGSPRLTGDVDFVAERPLPSFPVVGSLSFGGDKLVTSEGVPVDLVLRNDEYTELYTDALADATGRTPKGELPVVRPEYIAAMKMAAGRGKDMADLEFLVTDGHANLDEVRAIVRRHLGSYAARELDQLVLVAQWKKDRER